MYVKYQLNRDNRFVKTVITKKNLKLHKFATCNTNFKKSLFSDMHYPTPDILPTWRPIGMLVIVQLRSKDISTEDGRTNRHRD